MIDQKRDALCDKFSYAVFARGVAFLTTPEISIPGVV
tara:strand:- start:635 stop:745 length:111 start_codon:yes stop_codon:yes gene_type:complete